MATLSRTISATRLSQNHSQARRLAVPLAEVSSGRPRLKATRCRDPRNSHMTMASPIKPSGIRREFGREASPDAIHPAPIREPIRQPMPRLLTICRAERVVATAISDDPTTIQSTSTFGRERAALGSLVTLPSLCA